LACIEVKWLANKKRLKRRGNDNVNKNKQDTLAKDLLVLWILDIHFGKGRLHKA